MNYEIVFKHSDIIKNVEATDEGEALLKASKELAEGNINPNCYDIEINEVE